MRERLSMCLLAGVLAVGCGVPALGADPPETKEQHDQRMDWFRKGRLGMFIHWGVYCVPTSKVGGTPRAPKDEWFFDVPVSEYEKYGDEFNPVKFDAKRIVAAAKDIGAKYIVVTSKHHDGFNMFDTKMSDWGIMSSPLGRDPMKELAAACKDAGIKFCFYYSILDRHHPDYEPRRAENDLAKGPPNLDRYVEKYMKEQLKELVNNYGPLGIMWFDGEWEKSWTHERGKDLYAFVRGLQPDIIINNRVGKNRKGMSGISEGDEIVGDYDTPEQEVPAGGLPGVDWESCITMNDHWYNSVDDKRWKSPAELIRMLVDIASKGGNMLLNVGPTSEGVLSDLAMERLGAIGQWMKLNGQAIYGTTAGPFTTTPAWGRATQKPGTLYLHVFDWPKDGRLEVAKVPGKRPTAAYLLADPKRASLKVTSDAAGFQVAVPATAPDAAVSVIVVSMVDE